MASITQSQVAFLKTKFLNEIGASKEPLALPVVENILAEYAKAFIGTAVKNAEKKRMTSTGKLQSDLEFRVNKNGAAYEINIGYDPASEAAEYYDYQNKGVAGVGKSIASPYAFKTLYASRKMATSILLWLRQAKNAGRFEDQTRKKSGLQIKRKKMGKMVDKSKDLQGLAFGISRKIKRDGIKPTRFFDDAITSTFNKDFINVMGKALAADVTLKIIRYGDNN